MIRKIVSFVLFCHVSQAIIHDSYTGTVATPEQIAAFKEADILDTCTNDIEPCNESDWRRVDGSCNNPNYPSRGCYHTPQYWLVEPEFGENFGERLTKNGKPFKPARYITRHLLEVGKAADDYFNQLASLFIEFIFSDVGSAHDIRKWKTDYMCTPNYIPEYDPVHRFSGVSCLNLTKQVSFQNVGCVANNTRPDRLDFATSYYDLSNTYHFQNTNISNLRTAEGGELKTEIINGGEFPSDGNSSCLIKDEIATGCTRHVPNAIIGTNILSAWWWRYHNYVARKLVKLNPCWSNDMIFYTARDTVIAFYVQVMYYEMLPHLLGRKSLISAGIIADDLGHRDQYDSSLVPQVAVELPYSLRHFHMMVDSDQKMFDEHGNFVKETPLVNYTNVVVNLTIDNTLLLFTHGLTKQNAGKIDDHVVHPHMSELGLGPLQRVFDTSTADLRKGRTSGVSSYRLYLLKQVYEHVEDVEFFAGVWSEGLMEGARVPPTIWCILMNQFKHSMAIDKHWYERPNRPHAFNYDQLLEIRKASMARLLCDVGDKVTRIQPNAFLVISPDNEVVDCSEIPSLNFELWKDPSCDCQ